MRGYDPEYEKLPAQKQANLFRKFERDKDDLKRLNIAIETVETDGDNRHTRYRIPKERVGSLTDAQFSPKEQALLLAAIKLWQQTALGEAAFQAQLKLSGTPAAAHTPTLQISPQLHIRDDRYTKLTDAIQRGKQVTFEYQTAGHVHSQKRTVAPLHLYQAEGRQLLITWDYDQGDHRTFLLRRITSDVKVLSKGYDPTLRDAVNDQIAQLHSITHRTEILVRSQAVHAKTLQARSTQSLPDAEGTVMHIPTSDLREFARELSAYGAEVEALHPPQLREYLAEVLHTVVDQHTRGTGITSGQPLTGRAAARRQHSTATSSFTGIEAVAFIPSLLNYVAEHHSPTLAELSAHFNLSEDVIEGIVRAVAVSGTPQDERLLDIDWDALEIEGRVIFTDVLGIDQPLQFTSGEAGQLLAGLLYLESFLDDSWHGALETAKQKLARFQPELVSGSARANLPPNYETVATAIADHRQLVFAYTGRDGARSTRTVTPLALGQPWDEWILTAYCHDRQAQRHFRLANMEQLEVGGFTTVGLEAAAARADEPEPQFVDSCTVATRDRKALKAYNIDYKEQAGAWFFGTAKLFWRGAETRLVGEAPGDVVITEPLEAQQRVAEWARTALNQYTGGENSRVR